MFKQHLFTLIAIFALTQLSYAQCVGGDVLAASGESTVYTCPGDGNADMVEFMVDGASEDTEYQFVVTDSDFNIVGIPPGNAIDVDGAGEGNCYVWGFAYTGDLTLTTGMNIFQAQVSTGCWNLSKKALKVVRSVPNAGTVALKDERTEKVICTVDGYDNIAVYTNDSPSNAAFRYVVTNDDNKVLAVLAGSNQNFEGVPAGTCYVWGVSYTGNLTIEAGDDITTSNLSDACFDLSENLVSITRTNADGGTVATIDGETAINTTPGDGISDAITFMHESAATASFAYIVTDVNNKIIGTPPGNTIDFEGAGEGICRVWGVSYTGDLKFLLGGTVGNFALSTDCFDVSENFVEVVRTAEGACAVNGGTVSTPDGETAVSIIAGDGIANVIEFAHEGNSDSNFAYVITDVDGNILGLPPGNSIDFDGAGAGVCLVWGLAYTGEITAQMGDNAMEVSLSSECYDLSDNVITVTRTGSEVMGGTVAMPSGATEKYTCANDGISDAITVVSEGATADANYTLVVTDTDGNILGVPPSDMVDVTGAGVGVCLVWGLSYTGELTAMAGDNAMETMLSSGAYALSSNYITLNRDEANGGTVSTPDGATEVNIVAGDGVADVIEFAHEDASNSNFTYVITDTDGNILGVPPGNSLDFEGAGAGVCLVWGLAYTGEITAMVGDNANDMALSSECFDLSDNFITVTRSASLSGGTVAMPSGATEKYTCANDGISDAIMVVSEGATADANYTLVVTDTDGNILGVPPSDMVDVTGAGVGVCLVWGLSYTGELTAMAGDNAMEGMLSSGAHALSSNYITLNRDEANGGMITTADGATEVNLIAGDGVADMIEFAHEGASNSNFNYIVTDTDGNILGVPPGNSVDFEGAGAGVCLVWGLAYTGELTAMVGDNANDMALSSECFDLSDSFVTVNRTSNLPSNADLLSTTSNNKLNFNLFPNPVAETLQVHLTNDWNTDLNTQITVFDALGRVVLQQQAFLTSKESNLQLDVETLHAGMYVLSIGNDQLRKTVTFVKK